MPSLAVGCYERFVFRYDYDNEGDGHLRKVSSAQSHKGHVRCLDACGSYLTSGGADDIIQLYRADSGDELGFFTTPSHDVHCLAFVPGELGKEDPSHLLGGAMDGSIGIWDVNTMDFSLGLAGHKGCVSSIAVHKSGKLALSTGRDKKLLLWDLVKGKKIYSGNLNQEGHILAFHPDEEVYLIASMKGVHQTSLENGEETGAWLHDRKIMCMAVLGDGYVGTGTENGVIRVWDRRAHSNPCIEVKDAHSTRIRGIDGMPEMAGLMAASASTDGGLKIWDFRMQSKNSSDAACVSEVQTMARLTCLKACAGDSGADSQLDSDSLSNDGMSMESEGDLSSGSNEDSVEEEEEEEDHAVGAVSNGILPPVNGGSDESSDERSSEELEEILSDGEEELGDGDGDVVFTYDSLKRSQTCMKGGIDEVPSSGDSSLLSEEEEEEEETGERPSVGVAPESNGLEPSGEDSNGKVDSVFGMSGEKASGKRKSGEDDVLDKKRRTRMKKSSSGEEGSLPGPSLDKPAEEQKAKESKVVKGILKGREMGGYSPQATPTKSVRFKSGDDIAEVVGVASGVGFDSVAAPNLAALYAAFQERGQRRGRGCGRGKGKGKGRGRGRDFKGGRGKNSKSGVRWR